MNDVQEKRNARLVEYFQLIYQRDKQRTANSGEEMMHEAYMSNYCLSLLDKDQKVVWEMNPNDIKDKDHIMMNGNSAEGVYNIERYT